MRFLRNPLPLTWLLLIALAATSGCSSDDDPTRPSADTAQTPAPEPWLRAFGSSSYDKSHDVAVDPAGNVFVAGAINGPVDFGGETFDPASGPVFLAKFNTVGDFVWVKQVPGAGPDGPLRLGTDNFGNVFLQGVFIRTLTIDGTVVSSAGGAEHVFVAKFDARGRMQWVQYDSGPLMSVGFGMDTGELGGTAVAGFIKAGATFGDEELTVQGFDYFVVSYDAGGNVMWAKQSGSDNRAIGAEVAVDPLNNVLVTGEFSESVTFDDKSLTSFGSRDAFITKYAAAGNVLWAKQIGDTGDDVAYGITTDRNGNVYVSGRLVGSTNTLWKFSPDGDLVWGADAPTADDLAVDRPGNVFLSGSFHGTVTVGEDELTSNGFSDFFVAGFDPTGQGLWAVSGGASRDDRAQGLAVDQSGAPIAVVDFYESFEFAGKTVASSGEKDILVFRLE